MMTIRYVRTIVWSGVIVLALLLAAVGWALTSQAALDWAIDRLSASLGGRLTVEGAKRTGIAALTVERVRYVDSGLAVNVRDAFIDVQFVPLLRGRALVRSLSAAHIDVVAAGSRENEPPALPLTLTLPFPVDVESLRATRISYAAAGEPIVLSDLDAAWTYDGVRHALRLRGLGTPWATVRGGMELGAERPFPIDAAVTVQPVDARVGTTHLVVAGELAAMGVGIVGQAYDASVRAKASVTPFGGSVLAHIDAKIDGIDPRSIERALPHARIDVTANAQVGRDGAILGRLQALNHVPGLPARDRLPIARLQGRFEGGGREWIFSDLVLDAGRAGRLTGRARLAPDALDADLAVSGLNLVGLHEAMYPTSLSGPIRVVRANGKLDFDARLREAATRIALAGTYVGDRVDLAQVQWSGPAGSIEAQGGLVLSERVDFDASGTLRGFDPARVGNFPSARLNAQFAAKGRARPLEVAFDATIADSRFRDQPLAGTARASIQADRVQNVVLDLSLGKARLQANGSLGKPGDRLAFDVNVPNARLIHPEVRGSARAEGSASGTFREPALAVALDAADLRYGERFAIGRISGKGSLEAGGSGRVDMDLSASALRAGETTLTNASVAVQGTRSRHMANITTRSPEHRLEAALSGGLDDGFAWQGLLQSMRVEGALPVRLSQPVALVLSRDTIRVGSARIDVGKSGRIDLAMLDWDVQRGVTSRGSLSGFALAALRSWLPIPEAVRSLVVAGHWDVVMAEVLAGSVSLTREAGDVSIPGKPPLQAKLRALRVDVRAEGGNVRFDARLDSETFGRATASGSTRVERRAGRWGIPGDAPIQARVQAEMPSLEWTRPLLEGGVSVAGRAEMTLQASGTFAQPLYEGHVRGQGLSARIPDLGLTLRDGVINAVFDGQRLAIETLRFVSGEGQIVGSGGARLVPGDLSAQIVLSAQKLTVLARPDRLAVVSGNLDVGWNPQRLTAKGQFTADRGVVELPREDTPRPSSDVIVLGTKPEASRPLNVEADLSLDLGRNFSLRGKGLDTRLVGTLRAQVNPKAGISLTGTVRAVDGTYSAFGRQLSIKRGALTFVGPVDNPSLDILAVRVVSDVEVGVAVGGTALVPQIRLVSTPAMSDANKLAWLTLGHGLDEAGKNEAAVLQAAALALLSRGDTGSKGTLASRFGLDDLSLGTASGTGERIVSIGKRFASNFYVGFERGITGAVSVIKITYDLSRRWSVQARAGSESAVDLFYTLGFR